MNYGMPYKGSKNRIAQKIVDVLPPGDVLVDLFGGGGAITHCAALSGKWEKIIYNELNPLIVKGFRMAVNGEFVHETRWISREDFQRLKSSDPYVAICFSFGNNLHDYAYGREIEPLKKALHNAGGAGKVENLERLRRLQNLEILDCDYREVQIPTGAVVYCDIPYRNTDTRAYGKQKFDYDAFYSWARKNPCYISEYNMPDDFKVVCNWEKQMNACAKASWKVTEKLFHI